MARKAVTPSVEAITVSIGTIGGKLQSVLLGENATVADALRATGLPESSEVRCNGEVYVGSDEVEDGDALIVLAGQKVKAGM